MNNPHIPGNRSVRLRRVRAGVSAGAVLIGATVLGASAATADSQTPAPSPSPSAPAQTGKGAPHAKHPFAQTLRTELRVDIRSATGFGDKAHEIAYVLIHHTAAFSKLPGNLQTDLKTLEAAPASERDSDATKIKETALNGGYGSQIQKEATTIQAKARQAPAKP